MRAAVNVVPIPFPPVNVVLILFLPVNVVLIPFLPSYTCSASNGYNDAQDSVIISVEQIQVIF